MFTHQFQCILNYDIPVKAKFNPKPPDAWWLKDTTRVNDYNCFMQKDTQPNQTFSEPPEGGLDLVTNRKGAI